MMAFIPWTKPIYDRRWSAKIDRLRKNGRPLAVKVNWRRMLTDPNWEREQRGRWLRRCYLRRRSHERWQARFIDHLSDRIVGA